MSNFDPAIHPVGLISRRGNAYGWETKLHFSRYFYRPQSVFDERECFQVSILDVTAEWLTSEVIALKKGWELALNSKVIDQRGRARHIGMIDFMGRPDMNLVSERVRNLLGARAAKRISYYDSGRSIHGYILELMGPAEWHRYLGRMLLMNAPDETPLVDARWIGHRLLGGYSALRWSANSQHYSQVPVLLRT